MTKEEFGPIEQEIVHEENLTKSRNDKPKVPNKLLKLNKSVLIASVKTWPTHLKNPKLITLVILTVVIFLTSFGLLSLSTNSIPTQQTQQQVLTSPLPQTSMNPTLNTIFQKVDSYNQKIDELNNFPKKLERPIVNLVITSD